MIFQLPKPSDNALASAAAHALADELFIGWTDPEFAALDLRDKLTVFATVQLFDLEGLRLRRLRSLEDDGGTIDRAIATGQAFLAELERSGLEAARLELARRRR